MEKFHNDKGQVAVLVSGGFGAGWSSWNPEISELLFDPEIVQMVLDEKTAAEIEEFANKKYDFYAGGAQGLRVEWLEPGTQFQITEYDGYEGLETNEDTSWSIA